MCVPGSRETVAIVTTRNLNAIRLRTKTHLDDHAVQRLSPLRVHLVKRAVEAQRGTFGFRFLPIDSHVDENVENYQTVLPQLRKHG